MIVIYIILAVGAVLFVGWVLYALNTEFELFIWINNKRRYVGCFECLADAGEYIYLQEAKGVNVTDWKIYTVRKKKYVKQIDDKLFIRRMNEHIINPRKTSLILLP